MILTQHKSLLFTLLAVVAIAVITSSLISSEMYPEDINQSPDYQRKASQLSKDYWYDGTAEISSYNLSQARYGELHQGNAVLVYVTEPFSPSSNTKADSHDSANIPVLKLNKTSKFNTGIYPYSMMNTTLYPFEDRAHSMKISTSIQEWCGMTYGEMTNTGMLNFDLDSYFQGESYQDKVIPMTLLEDDLWTLLRLNPDLLPTGDHTMIPSMTYLQLMHQETRAYSVNATLVKDKNDFYVYQLYYPELDRTLRLQFDVELPHRVQSWEETSVDGYGPAKKKLTTTATLINTLKTDYWNKNKTKDQELRTQLGLDSYHTKPQQN